MSIEEIKKLLATCLQQLRANQIRCDLFGFTIKNLQKISVLQFDHECLDLINEIKNIFESLYDSDSLPLKLEDEKLLLLAEFCHSLRANREARHLISQVSIPNFDNSGCRRQLIEVLGGCNWAASGMEHFPDVVFHSNLGLTIKDDPSSNLSTSLSFNSSSVNHKYTLLYSVNFSYFEKFVFPALCSALSFSFHDGDFNVVIVMPPNDIQLAQSYLKSTRVPSLLNTVFIPDPSLDEANFLTRLEYNTALCCARFRWAYKLLSMGFIASTLIIVDADQLFIGPFSLIESLIATKPSIALADWSKIFPFSTLYGKYGASILVCRLSTSNKALQYLKILSEYLDQHFNCMRPLWTIDQLALLHVAKICDLKNAELFTGLAPIISCGPLSSSSFLDALLYNQAGAAKFATNSYTELCSALTRRFLY